MVRLAGSGANLSVFGEAAGAFRSIAGSPIPP
jgi:hypothetical protein